MKNFTLQLLLVSSITTSTLYTAESARKAHAKKNPRAALLVAIEMAQVKEVQRALKDDSNITGLFPHAIKYFDHKKVDTATILTIIAKITPREEVEATLRGIPEKNIPKRDKARLLALKSLLSRAVRK